MPLALSCFWSGGCRVENDGIKDVKEKCADKSYFYCLLNPLYKGYAYATLCLIEILCQQLNLSVGPEGESSPMKLILSTEDFHEQFEDLKHFNEQPLAKTDTALEFPTPIAHGSSCWTQVRSGLSLEISHFQPHQDFALRARPLPSSPFPLRLLFFLTGHSKSVTQRSTATIESDFLPGHNILTLTTDSTITVEYQQGQSMQTVGIGIDPWVMHEFFADTAIALPTELRYAAPGHWEQPYFQGGITTPAMQMAIHQILNCPLQGLIRRLYLESKVVELIALKLAQIHESNQPASAKPVLKPGDVERIHLAKEILLRDIEHPPSLMRLSKLSGLNDYKLKQGFRQVFGTTVFGYLRRQRLEQARQRLIEGQMTVSEVARSVGYSSLSRFSLAFKQQFGVSPGACLSKRLK